MNSPGAGETTLTDLKTIQDWQVRREFRRIPGVIDVTAFGGTTKEYHVDIDPGRLISYGVNLSQVMSALTNSNANVGGNYLTIGAQNYNIRGLGLINGIADIENVMVAEKGGTPIFVKTLGKVAVGPRMRLGKVGIDDRDDVVEGVILLQRGYKALNVLEKVRGKVEDLNTWKLPAGVKIKTFYDRTALIHTTVETVTDILVSGMVLVFIILFVFLGHLRAALIVALTIPLSLLFTFSMMVLIGQSANLISLGSIDFGIIVDATLIMVESIFFHLAHGKNAWIDGPPADRAGCPAGGTADLLFHGDHRGGVHSALYDDGCAGKDFRAHVHHLWVCLGGRALDGLYVGPCACVPSCSRERLVRTIRRSCG